MNAKEAAEYQNNNLSSETNFIIDTIKRHIDSGSIDRFILWDVKIPLVAIVQLQRKGYKPKYYFDDETCTGFYIISW